MASAQPHREPPGARRRAPLQPGLGIRESDGYVTNTLSRFVAHVIAG